VGGGFVWLVAPARFLPSSLLFFLEGLVFILGDDFVVPF